MFNSEYPYWMAIAHIGGWSTEKKNTLIIRIVHDIKLSLQEFWGAGAAEWRSTFGLTETDVTKLELLRKELPNYAFLAEDLLEQGYNIVTLDSSVYSQTLKNNLKTKYSPPVLYTKGNDRLLNERAVAVVGSRQASPFSLEFADRIADKVVKEDSVIVSGFAQGVDKQALDSTLGHHGRSIIVLPQGIMTFSSGLKQYYQHIWEGDVLVLSTFLPKARWSTALAMARNPIIYGLAEEIYVAECQEKGGTWAGAIDGLRKGRTIYVRRPDPSESNANELLIARGAIEVELGMYSHSPQVLHVMETSDKAPIWDNELVKRIVELLTHSKKLSAKAIMEKLSLKIDKKDLIKLLESTPNFERSTDKKYKLKAIEKPDQPRLL